MDLYTAPDEVKKGVEIVSDVLCDWIDQLCATGIDAVAWAEEAARRGAGEILLTSMDRDGTKAGFDLALTRAVARAVPIPVIASGGVGALEHFAEGVIEGEADAVLAASVFHFGTFSIREVKEYMASQGIPVRLDF